MAFAEHLNDPAPVRGNPCSVKALLTKLPEDEAAAFQVMLTGTVERHWSQEEIYALVLAEGHKVGRQSINTHRNGRCGCGKSGQ